MTAKINSDEKTGDEHLLAGDYDAAAAAYAQARKALVGSASEGRLVSQMVTVEERRGRYVKALALCDSLRRGGPSSAWVDAVAARTLCYVGRADEAQRRVERAFAAASDRDTDAEPLLQALLHRAQGNIHLVRGEPMAAVASFEAGRVLCAGKEPLELSIAHANLGEAWSLAERFTQALRDHNEALRLKTALGDVWGTAHTYQRMAGVHIELAEPRLGEVTPAHAVQELTSTTRSMLRLAEQEVTRGMELATKIGESHLVASCHVTTGRLYLLTGDTDRALVELRTGWTAARRINSQLGTIEALIGLARCHRARHAYTEAAEAADDAGDLAREVGAAHLVLSATLEALLAAIASGDRSAAIDSAQTARATAEAARGNVALKRRVDDTFDALADRGWTFAPAS